MQKKYIWVGGTFYYLDPDSFSQFHKWKDKMNSVETSDVNN